MNLDSLKKRTLRILTTPPELLYALGRHWAILASCLSVGVIVTAAKVATDPLHYEGTATLIVDTKDPVAGGQLRDSRDQVSRRLNEQQTILLGSTTLRHLVKELKVDRVLKQSMNPEERQYTGAREIANRVRKQIADSLEWLENPTSNDWGEERQIQLAIRGFRSRSRVTVNGKNNTIRLSAYGVDRDILRREIETWIRAYKSRVKQMHQEGTQAYLNDRIGHYERVAEAARIDLNEYRKANPRVSQTETEHLHEQVVEWRLLRSDLERRLDFFDESLQPTVAARTNATSSTMDPEVAWLKTRSHTLQLEIDEKTATKGPQSRVVQNLRDRKEVMDARLASMDVDETSSEISTSSVAQKRRKRLEDQMNTATGRLAELMIRERSLRERLEELQQYENQYSQARERVKFYKTTSLEDEDRGKLAAVLSVRVSDRPEVSTTPANRYPHKQVLFGSVGGLTLGLMVAIFLEVLSARIRFRNDVTSEFGLPVVGVIPKR